MLIRLRVPIPIEAGQTRCLYIHATGSPNGRGLLCRRIVTGPVLCKDGDVELRAGGAALSRDPKASVFFAGGAPLRVDFGLVGGIRYDLAPQAAATMQPASRLHRQ